MSFKKKLKLFCEENIRAIALIYFLLIIFRVLETSIIFLQYNYQGNILASEILGLCFDILGVSIFIICYSIVHYVIFIFSPTAGRYFNKTLLYIYVTIYLLITKYFLYQLIPLDVFLYKYSRQEIFFTLKTTDFHLIITLLAFISIVVIVYALTKLVKKIVIKNIFVVTIYSFVFVSLLLFFAIGKLFNHNNFSLNKSSYFIIESTKYFLNSKETTKIINFDLNQLYPNKIFIDKDFPLIHSIDRENDLIEYFETFDKRPNIVLLIIEGLNDDFIHKYKGSMLMPFLNQLKSKSLYWSKCFTLGERSFAVVPSVLGGLPYGNLGFTLQDVLPRHLSLVSILKSNGYYTSFYYGQGAWFHKKDRFFKYNDIDLIFDNNMFSNDYQKIIVGKNKYFWGYNDKDLFSQSLKVTDTLNQKQRFDIYFTGSSHSPFVVDNVEYYDEKLKNVTHNMHIDFYKIYSTYLKSILFVDDALEDFFNEYEKRDEFDNTIFIITGDHPITEIPIANSLKRYHVPLLIFSKKLKECKTFNHIVSHLDISETLLTFLQNYSCTVPDFSTSLGNNLFNTHCTDSKCFAFMNDNRNVVDILCNNFYLSENSVFIVDSTLGIKEINDSNIKTMLINKLNNFQNSSLYLTQNNKIISNDLYCKALNHNNIFELKQIDNTNIFDEYYSLVKNTFIRTNHFIFDISLNVKCEKDSKTFIVYQISDLKDSVLMWKNMGLNNGAPTQAHIPITIDSGDSVFVFKSYIWNQNKKQINISNIDILLHSPN